MAASPHAHKHSDSLSERKQQIDVDWELIYNAKSGILPAIKHVLRLPMPAQTLAKIADLLAAFSLPFLNVCSGALPIRTTMPAERLISILYNNVKVRMDNGMVIKNKAASVRKLRLSLFNLMTHVSLIYKQFSPVADDDKVDEMEDEEFEEMPRLESEESAQERERNKRYDCMLAKSRRESEALDIAEQSDMVDGFFDYNPHKTTHAMEQARYMRQVALHNSMIMRSEEAIQRRHFFANHAYDDWRNMDACLQNVTEMPLIDQHNHGFF